MRGNYIREKIRLQQIIDTGEQLLSHSQLRSRSDQKAKEAEVEKVREQMMKLPEQRRVELNRIWDEYRLLWPKIFRTIQR